MQYKAVWKGTVMKRTGKKFGMTLLAVGMFCVIAGFSVYAKTAASAKEAKMPETMEAGGNRAEAPETAEGSKDHAEAPETTGDGTEAPETTEDGGDHAETPETTGDGTETPEATEDGGDHAETPEATGDGTEAPETTEDGGIHAEEPETMQEDQDAAKKAQRPMLRVINDRFEVDGITYKEVGSGEVRLMSGQNCSGNLTIPERVKRPGSEKEYQVVSIAERAFSSNKNLTGITFPQGLTGIGDYAFYGTGLTGNLVLPGGLEYLGSYAFGNCTGLSGDLVLPDSLTTMEKYAFYNCSGLDGSLVLPRGLERIEEHTFYGCSGLSGSVALPDSLVKVGSNAFHRSNLTCETSQESVAALVYGTGYRNITLNGAPYSPGPGNNTVFVVGDFYYKIIDEDQGYVSLSSTAQTPSGVVNIPASIEYQGKTYQVTEIGDMAFYNKGGITGINLPNGLQRIGKDAFGYCSGLRGTLRLPGSLRSIGEGAFSYCSGLTGSLVLPEGLTSIEKNAFFQCTGFNGSLVLPDGLREVKEAAFYNCSGFRGSLPLPEGLERIEENAFYNCCSLTGRLTIPESVVYIGSTSFQLCSKISEFYVGGGVQTIGTSAFPYRASLVTDSPRVQLLLTEYLNVDEIPTAFWDGTEDVPGGAVVTVKQDLTIVGDRYIGADAEVRIAPGITVTVEGNVTIDGTVRVEGTLLEEGTIRVTDTGRIIKRQQQKLTVSETGNKTYGDDSFLLSADGGSGTGGLRFESSDPAVLDISGATAIIRKAGSVTVTAVREEDFTYQESEPATLEILITKKEVTFWAEDVSAKRGDAMPVFTYKPVELAYQDKVETDPVLSCTAADTETIGEYPIEIRGAVVTNQDSYTIQYKEGSLRIADRLYRLTVHNPGDGITAEGEYAFGDRISVHAGAYSGYTFEGWSSDNGGTFENALLPDTVFTMPKANAVLTAVWKKTDTSGGSDVPGEGDISGGDDTPGGENPPGEGDIPGGDDTQGGGSIPGGDGTLGGDIPIGSGDEQGKTEAAGKGAASGQDAQKSSAYESKEGSDGSQSSRKADAIWSTEAVEGTVLAAAQSNGAEDGSVWATVTAQHIRQGILSAKQTAAKRNVNAGNISVLVHINADKKEADSIILHLPRETQKQIVDQKICHVTFTADNPGISVELDLAAVEAMQEQARGDIQLIAVRTDASVLTKDAKKAAGKRPVFAWKVLYNNGADCIGDFGAGSVCISVPYDLQRGEQAGGLYAFSVGESGSMQIISYSVYDSDAGQLRFITNRCLLYGIGCRPVSSYRDVKKDREDVDDICFAQSRNLMDATAKSVFAPDTAIPWGQFVTALGRLTGIWPTGEEILSLQQPITRGEALQILSDYAKADGRIHTRACRESFHGKEAFPDSVLTRAEACTLLRYYVEFAIGSYGL